MIARFKRAEPVQKLGVVLLIIAAIIRLVVIILLRCGIGIAALIGCG